MERRQEKLLPYTPAEILDYFIRNDKPLPGEVIRLLVEPLAGSSFLEVFTKEMRWHASDKRRGQHNALTASVFLDMLWGRHHQTEQIQHVDDPLLWEQAIRAFHSLATRPVHINNVYLTPWLREASEMMVIMSRWDTIYHDAECTQRAFQHYAGQRYFYKGNRQLQVIPITMAASHNADETLIQTMFIPEGIQPMPFFSDENAVPFPALSREQQQKGDTHRSLYISPRFSLQAVQRK